MAKTYMTGATGRLGSAVKIKAVPLVRKKSGMAGEVVTDFSEAQLRGIFKDAECVIHLAGSVDTLDAKKMQEANVELTKRLVSALPEGCRMVFSGSVSVYGKKLPELPADEGTQVNPDSEYARTKYEAEKIVASHPNHVILRIGTIYGPQFSDYHRVLSMIERRKMRVIGDGKNRIPFVHVDDAADAVASAAKKGSGIYVIAGEPLTQDEVYSIAARELGVEKPEKHISIDAALAFASFGEWRYKLGGKKPALTKEHISVLGYDRVFDCSKARKELGFSPRPLEQGIMEIVKQYKIGL